MCSLHMMYASHMMCAEAHEGKHYIISVGYIISPKAIHHVCKANTSLQSGFLLKSPVFSRIII
jgi:hypothetical protein